VIQPKSIRRKLQGWVIVVFVLTGAAGWAGIWGLFWLSGETRALASTDVAAAEGFVTLERKLVDARAETAELRALLALPAPAAITAEDGTVTQPPPPSAVAAATRLSDAWLLVEPAFQQISARPEAAALVAARAEQQGALEALVAAARAEGAAREGARGKLAAYDATADALLGAVRGASSATFQGAELRAERVSDGISLLQAVLFATVAICQLFSAWAGWQLARTLGAQLGELKESAERISMGDLASEVKLVGADEELHEVGEALDRLRVSLAKAMERLAARKQREAPVAQA